MMNVPQLPHVYIHAEHTLTTLTVSCVKSIDIHMEIQTDRLEILKLVFSLDLLLGLNR